jgi:hypothetical protein
LTAGKYCAKIFVNYIQGDGILLATVHKKKTSEAFDDKLLLFAENDTLPFAYRAPVPETHPYDLSGGRKIEKIGQFEIYDTNGQLVCRYSGKPTISALIAPLDEHTDISDKAEAVIGYLRTAYSLELSSKHIKEFEDFTFRISERCGCLTDIYCEENALPIESNGMKPDSAFIAVTMPIIALMYRRISALRGFNFKITIQDGLLCLVFSARVILPIHDTVIPEKQVLCSIAGTDDLSFIHRLTDLEEDCEGGRLFKLSVAICPQTADPRGILRAPEWKKHTDSILSKIDLDVPGRF